MQCQGLGKITPIEYTTCQWGNDRYGGRLWDVDFMGLRLVPSYLKMDRLSFFFLRWWFEYRSVLRHQILASLFFLFFSFLSFFFFPPPHIHILLFIFRYFLALFYFSLGVLIFAFFLLLVGIGFPGFLSFFLPSSLFFRLYLFLF